MSTYPEKKYISADDTTFQDIYDSIINELINLENLTPNKSRLAILESILKQLCKCIGSDTAFIFELLNQNIYELKLSYSVNNNDSLKAHPIMFPAEEIPDWHNKLSNREIIIEDNIGEIDVTQLTNENKKLLSFGVNSVIAFPISYAGKQLGYIRLDSPSFPVVPAHLRLMKTIGIHLGSIWQNIDKDFLLMQNKNLINKNKFELEKEQQFLDVLCRDYTSVYYVDLEKNTLEPFKLDRVANAANFISAENPGPFNYTEMIETYSRKYVAPESVTFFENTMSIVNLKNELKYKERIVFRYRSVPNLLRQQYFETIVVRISTTSLNYQLLLGFRHIDNIVALEQKRQFELEQALTEATLKNEVISALSQIYNAIFLINLEKDSFKEISGKGTTFTITLEIPYLKKRSRTPHGTLTLDNYSKICSGMHLLVAEDNELNYEVISELLKMHNITCEHAADGSICVEMLKSSKQHNYDAILMDMQMPVMNGLYATTAIRNLEIPEAHSIPIIAMTANAFKEDIEKCLNAGMNKYLSKPVDIFSLLKVLSEYRNNNKKHFPISSYHISI